MPKYRDKDALVFQQLARNRHSSSPYVIESPMSLMSNKTVKRDDGVRVGKINAN
jgi:hypothetical protein